MRETVCTGGTKQAAGRVNVLSQPTCCAPLSDMSCDNLCSDPVVTHGVTAVGLTWFRPFIRLSSRVLGPSCHGLVAGLARCQIASVPAVFFCKTLAAWVNRTSVHRTEKT